MRRPGNQANEISDRSTANFAVPQRARDRRVLLPSIGGDDDKQQTSPELTDACPSDMADYLAEILASLETMARHHKLQVLSLMLTMAREQAEDDAMSSRSP